MCMSPSVSFRICVLAAWYLQRYHTRLRRADNGARGHRPTRVLMQA